MPRRGRTLTSSEEDEEDSSSEERSSFARRTAPAALGSSTGGVVRAPLQELSAGTVRGGRGGGKKGGELHSGADRSGGAEGEKAKIHARDGARRSLKDEAEPSPVSAVSAVGVGGKGRIAELEAALRSSASRAAAAAHEVSCYDLKWALLVLFTRQNLSAFILPPFAACLLFSLVLKVTFNVCGGRRLVGSRGNARG